MKPILERRVFPEIERHYCGAKMGTTACEIILKDAFIVRYTQGKQPSLGEHVDGHHVSFNIALSDPDDYEGGGTSFAPRWRGDEDVTIRISQGSVLCHPARVLHSGAETKNGTRYLLVGFTELAPRTWRAAVASYLLDLHGGLARGIRKVVIGA